MNLSVVPGSSFHCSLKKPSRGQAFQGGHHIIRGVPLQGSPPRLFFFGKTLMQNEDRKMLLYFRVWKFWNKWPRNIYEGFRLVLTCLNQETWLSKTPGAIHTGFVPNLIMKTIKLHLLFGGTLLYSAIFLRIPKSYMISVYKILQCPIGLIQLEESHFSVVLDAGF